MKIVFGIVVIGLTIFATSCGKPGVEVQTDPLQAPAGGVAPDSPTEKALMQLEKRYQAVRLQWKNDSAFITRKQLFEKGLANLRVQHKKKSTELNQLQLQSDMAVWLDLWLQDFEKRTAELGRTAATEDTLTVAPPASWNTDFISNPMQPETSDKNAEPVTCNPSQLPGFGFRALNQCVNKALDGQDYQQAVDLLQLQIQPFNSILLLSRNTIRLARVYQAQNNLTDAQRVLEEYLVFKPALKEWLDSAEQLEAEIYAMQKQSQEQLQSLLSQVRNLHSTQSSYPEMNALLDSLEQAPLPSATRAEVQQMRTALLERDKKLADSGLLSLQKLVLHQARFEEARELNATMQKRFAHFNDELGLDTIAAFIDAKQSQFAKQKQVSSNAAVQGSPQEWHEQARTLFKEKKYLQAKAMYTHVLVSPLRSQVLDEYALLAEEFCQEKRKQAAEYFGTAQNEPEAVKRVKQIEKAIQQLDICLDEFPDVSIKPVVERNKQLLQSMLP
jgi:hypothetical protein